MSSRTIRAWFLVHKWSSLICTLFLLMLCLTGLPLIFHDEIEAMTGEDQALAVTDAGPRSLDEILAIALSDRPGHVGLFMSFDEDRPVVNVTTGPRPDAAETDMTLRSFDLRTGELVGIITDDGVMHFLLQLHTDMFLGLPGMLFLGVMGVLFFVATVSGVVLYAPFMRKLAFGTVRASRSRRVKWLDYHNLLGIVTLAWGSVVGLTGVINTLATPIVQVWQAGDLSDMTAAYKGQDPVAPDQMGSLQAAVDMARRAAPGNWVQFVAFPGGTFSTGHHYAVFLQGDTPLTKKLLTPALVDARTGELTAMRPLPWYVQTLLMSQPLHFGDYGGLPLKILWAVLDLFSIVILGSGLYLWLAKRGTASDARLREIEASVAVRAAP
ncbi:PepSY domain-containing protein [Niveispirillum sp.]|uniref:PepSY-associated TM helix domain-containing protein n=1 Tax=Niveispirillum sp. TaxID=1917217 RepID=UPI001B40D224|nr:PepSY domain-containing protein [Niveispirillum sp.]MBP7335145.1 PepSY domain-containing protein [Niveispirillum sp.]